MSAVDAFDAATFRASLAAVANVPVDAVTLTVSSGSIVVSAEIRAEPSAQSNIDTAAAAAQIQTALTALASDPATASSTLGVPVLTISIPNVATVQLTPPQTPPPQTPSPSPPPSSPPPSMPSESPSPPLEDTGGDNQEADAETPGPNVAIILIIVIFAVLGLSLGFCGVALFFRSGKKKEQKPKDVIFVPVQNKSAADVSTSSVDVSVMEKGKAGHEDTEVAQGGRVANDDVPGGRVSKDDHEFEMKPEVLPPPKTEGAPSASS